MRRGMKTFLLGLITVVLGSVVIPYVKIKPLFDAKYPEFTFKGPCEEVFMIDAPGKYYLWNDYQTFFENKNYDVSKKLPNGVKIKMTDSESGKEIAFNPDSSINFKVNRVSQNSVGYIVLGGKTNVKITIDGLSEDRVFTLAQSKVMDIFSTVIGTIITAGVLTVFGIFLVIWGIVKLSTKKKEDELQVD